MPLLASLAFGGRDPGKRYIPVLCGIAFWTGVYLNLDVPPIWEWHWNYIGLYLLGAVIAAFSGLAEHYVRVIPKKYFAERGEERRWRKAITEKWDA